MKVVLICGGQSTEHLISRMSCTNIRKHIKDNYEVKVLGISQEGLFYEIDDHLKIYQQDNWLENSKEIKDIWSYLKTFDVAFPVLHGQFGEDGTIQGLLEMAGIPYVGCRVFDSATAMDKVMAKKIFNQANIKQTPSLFAYQTYQKEIKIIYEDMSETTNIEEAVEKNLGFPVFVKASRSGSSVGCYKVNKADELLDKLKEAFQYDKKVLIEKAIDCIELEVAVLGNDELLVSRVGQILPHGEFYTFDSKYNDAESQTVIPALIDEDKQEYIRKEAKRIFKAMDGHGLSRIDFFLDKKTDEIYLNEVNTLPGFTNISMYPSLMKDSGIDTPELIDRLIKLAFER